MANRTVLLPGCKSTTQRALICAALGEGTVRLVGVSDADDCCELAASLIALGASISVGGNPQEIVVVGCCRELPNKNTVIDCGSGGTTLRFMMAICALQRGKYLLQVSQQLRGRPQDGLLNALKKLGVLVSLTDEGWEVDSRAFAACDVDVDCSQSSQFASALLLAQFPEDKFAVRPYNLESSVYHDLTVQVLADFGSCPEVYSIPSDLSAAIFFAGASLLTQQEVSFERAVNCEHPERYALSWLQQHCGLLLSGASFAVDGEFNASPDEIVYAVAKAPDASLTVAVVCRCLGVNVKFDNAQLLTFKECDRLSALSDMQTATEKIDCRQDHRVVMAAALLKLRYPQLQLTDVDCVSKSFPNFFDQWRLVNR